jgi:DNA polymerase-3 subunit alpha
MQAERIIGIELIGKKPTMDIEVDNDDHLFFANGILTSNSHSYSYGYISYITAYIKTHFPLQFFWSYLDMARNEAKPREEIAELVEDAKKFDIWIQPPSIHNPVKRFSIIDNKIYYGITDIKGVGESNYNKLMDHAPFDDKTWHQWLTTILPAAGKTAAIGLIKSGALGHLGIDRTRMLYEYNLIHSELKPKELNFIAECCETMEEGISKLLDLPVGRGEIVTQKKRLSKLEEILYELKNPPYSLKDTAADIAKMETDMLGLPIVCTKLGDSDKAGLGNSDCASFLSGQLERNIILPCIIDDVRQIVTKKGDPMAFLKLKDDSGTIETAVVFPKAFAEVKKHCQNGSIVLVNGNRDKKNKNNLIVEKISDIN